MKLRVSWENTGGLNNNQKIAGYMILFIILKLYVQANGVSHILIYYL